MMKYQNLKTDLKLRHFNDARSSLFLEDSGGDLLTCDGRENLAQAIWLRLAIGRGELESLGHKHYGSRLYQLIGRRLNNRTLELAKAYIREALRDEERVKEVLDLEVYQDPTEVNTLIASFRVSPRQGEPVNLQFSQSLA